MGEWVGRDAQPHSELTVKAVAMRARRTRRTTPQQPKATFMVVPVGRRVGRRTLVVTQRAATPLSPKSDREESRKNYWAFPGRF